MPIKTHITASLMTVALTGLIAGCTTTTTLQPGAESIKIIQSPVPQSCQFLGQLSSSDVNGVTQSYSSHQNLQIDEINTIKNQALALGANAIVIIGHQTTYIKHVDNSKRVDTHALKGEAYQCKMETLGSLKAQTINDISDAKNE